MYARKARSDVVHVEVASVTPRVARDLCCNRVEMRIAATLLKTRTMSQNIDGAQTLCRELFCYYDLDQHRGGANEDATSTCTLPTISDCASQRILFIGDSTVRYFYLSLALLIERIRVDWGACSICWIPDAAQAHTLAAPNASINATARCGSRCPWNEKSYPSWDMFYNETTALFGGRMLCDCHRDRNENRFLATKAGGSLSFLSLTRSNYFGNYQVSGEELPAYGHGSHGRSFESQRWRCDIAHLEKCIFTKRLRPDLIVWNIGVWRAGKLLSAAEFMRIHSSLERVSPRVVFMSTIARQAAQRAPLQLPANKSIEVFNTSRNWRWDPVRPPYWDGNTHLDGPGNRRLAAEFAKRFLASRSTDLQRHAGGVSRSHRHVANDSSHVASAAVAATLLTPEAWSAQLEVSLSDADVVRANVWQGLLRHLPCFVRGDAWDRLFAQPPPPRCA